jgi:hypothetical protein
MKKHGNTKYKFDHLINIGDTITERPNNVYSLKAAFRQFNLKRKNNNEPELEVSFEEYGGKRCDVVLTGFKTLTPQQQEK